MNGAATSDSSTLLFYLSTFILWNVFAMQLPPGNKKFLPPLYLLYLPFLLFLLLQNTTFRVLLKVINNASFSATAE